MKSPQNFKGRRAKFNKWKEYETFCFSAVPHHPLLSVPISISLSKYFGIKKRDYPSVRITGKTHIEIPIEIFLDDVFFYTKYKRQFFIYWKNPKAKTRPKNHKYGACNVWKRYKKVYKEN